MLNETLDTIADSVNPGSYALRSSARGLTERRFAIKVPAWYFWARTLASVVVVYAVMYTDNRLGLWPRLGLDYSTHTAFAVAIITSLAVVSFRWLFFLIPCLIGYAGLMLYLGYHTMVDILTTALVIAPVTWGIHRIGRADKPAGVNASQKR